MGVESSEAHRARVQIYRHDIGGVSAGDDALDAGPATEVEQTVTRCAGGRLHETVAVHPDIHHRVFVQLVTVEEHVPMVCRKDHAAGAIQVDIGPDVSVDHPEHMQIDKAGGDLCAKDGGNSLCRQLPPQQKQADEIREWGLGQVVGVVVAQVGGLNPLQRFHTQQPGNGRLGIVMATKGQGQGSQYTIEPEVRVGEGGQGPVNRREDGLIVGLRACQPAFVDGYTEVDGLLL